MKNCYKYVKDSIHKRKLWMDSLKNKPCVRCNVPYPPYVMEWHHIDPTTKKFSVGRGGYRNSRKLILEEIAKCILVCSNCHSIIEHEKRDSAKGEMGISSLS